jgi:serine protease
MRRSLAAAAVAAIAFLAGCDTADQPLAPPEPSAAPGALPDFSARQLIEEVVPGRVLVRLREGADPAELAGAHGAEAGALGRGFRVFRGAPGTERAMAARLRADARVLWAEPDYIRQPTSIDPRLWAFYNPGGLEIAFTRGQNKGQPVTSYLSTDDADEDNVEGYAAGGSAVAIASIDTGVDFGHAEFLPGQLVAGWDYYDDDADPTDSDGHGTHTTGTMAGQTVGVAGVSGAGPNVTVHVYRVCGAVGCPTSAIVNAIRDAADAGVVAMNLSLGGGSLSQAEADAIEYATTNGALVVASAGNGGTGTVSCPACDPNAISVAASNWQDERSYYSNWGSGLDITAPGGELYSNTTEEAGIYSSVPGGYAYLQGTSMSAPQVTGTAAIVASAAGLTGAALRSRILGTTDDLGPNGYDTDFGNGRLNSYRAVTGNTLDEGGPPPPPPTLVAAFSYRCNQVDCSFDGSASTGATSWDWTFGDGGEASGETAAHSYAAAGDYTVTLTVGDGSGGTDATSETVQCSVRGKRLRCR